MVSEENLQEKDLTKYGTHTTLGGEVVTADGPKGGRLHFPICCIVGYAMAPGQT